MTTKPIKPGDEVFIANRYYNRIEKKIVQSVHSNGANLQGEPDRPFYTTSFEALHRTREDAIRYLIKRAEADVAKQAKALKASEDALAKLKRKFAGETP